MSKELQQLIDEITEWSNTTFGSGQRNPAIIHHLRKEVDELIKIFDDVGNLKPDTDIEVLLNRSEERRVG